MPPDSCKTINTSKSPSQRANLELKTDIKYLTISNLEKIENVYCGYLTDNDTDSKYFHIQRPFIMSLNPTNSIEIGDLAMPRFQQLNCGKFIAKEQYADSPLKLAIEKCKSKLIEFQKENPNLVNPGTAEGDMNKCMASYGFK